jgi:hypothetical protein
MQAKNPVLVTSVSQYMIRSHHSLHLYVLVIPHWRVHHGTLLYHLALVDSSLTRLLDSNTACGALATRCIHVSVAEHGVLARPQLDRKEGTLLHSAHGIDVGLGWVPNRNPYEGIWVPAPVAKGSFADDGSPTVVADLSSVNGTVLAVR